MKNKELIKCENCGALNEIALGKIQQGNKPICGQCQERLNVDGLITIASYEKPSPKTSLFLSAPVIIACLLLIALTAMWAMRWDYGATNSVDAYVLKWKIDRWSNQGWVEMYTHKGIVEQAKWPGTDVTGKAQAERDRLTIYWLYAVTASIALLLWGLLIYPYFKRRREEAGTKAIHVQGYHKVLYLGKKYIDILALGSFYVVLVIISLMQE